MRNQQVTDTKAEARRCFQSYQKRLYQQTDRMFGALLVAEWVGAVAVSLILTPRTWNGAQSSMHPHVWATLFGGGAISLLSLLLILTRSGQAVTRQVIAISQILMSVLLIDVTGGRIETHFHIFGSLAFLAFYRDWRVLATASAVTAADHVIRGVWWPQSVYGFLTVSPWRWVEHAGWVLFEDIFLLLSCRRSLQEMEAVADREAYLLNETRHDLLTGLGNRALLQTYFDTTWASRHAAGHRAALLFIDLDRFKEVNDTLGHAIGDKILVIAAERMSTVLASKGLLARVGGDEFVILTESLVDHQAAPELAADLLSAITQPFQVDNSQLFLSASIGIALIPDHGIELNQVQEAADVAMYEAKAQGRHQFAVFSPEFGHRAAKRRALERDLHGALEAKQFELYFQPQVDAVERVTGLEALIRWHHPEYGIVSPGDFIPFAEKSGLILPIGEWVLREACRHGHAWLAAGLPPQRIAVNVASAQLDLPNFADVVESALADADFPPSLLELEMTESALIVNQTLAVQHLRRLRALGVQVAIDDFGTGYSSLQYLEALPIDRLKIDRSFIQQSDNGDFTLVRSVIGMAHALGLQVVAEGIERREQYSRLSELGCNELQGYYFSPPIPAGAVEALLRRAASKPQPEWAEREMLIAP